MNALILVALVTLSAAYALPSIGHGAIIAGPAGASIVTGASHHGAVIAGHAAHGAVIAGPAAHGAVVAAPAVHGAVIAGPALGLGLGHAGLGLGLGHAGIGLAGLGHIHHG